MTYKDLARTFEILSKYAGDKEYMGDWAEHDEYGYGIEFPLTIDEIKELRNMGWLLCCDVGCEDEDAIKWDSDNKETTNEELLELWNKYKSIYKYA